MIALVTENVDGNLYVINANSVDEILQDYNGECNFVPENDAPVHLLIIDGHVIKSFPKRFEDCLNYLRFVDIAEIIKSLLKITVGDDYVENIFDSVFEDVKEDVFTSSDYQNSGAFNDDDVRMAIGRVLSKRLGVEA